MGAETDLSLTVRGLAAAEQGEQVILLLWDGGSRYYQCATAVQRSALQEVLEQFDFGVSTFAFEEEAGQHLAPLSLFPDPLPELPQLTAGDAAVSTETLLTALGFNPTQTPAMWIPAARRSLWRGTGSSVLAAAAPFPTAAAAKPL